MKINDEVLVDTIKLVLFESKGAKIDKLARLILHELEQRIYEVYNRKYK